MSDGKEHDDVIRAARKRFDLAWEYERDNREQAQDDLKFRAGEQWPEEVKRERTQASRPTLTINRMPQFVKQVTGDIRQNRPSIKARPVDSGSDPELAEVFTGIIRHIEQSSDAQSAYVTAAEAAATCGIGHFRIDTEFTEDDGFEQDIRIKRIRNPFAVYWDPNSEELTREDARWCFVTERITLEEFEDRYPDAKDTDFEGATESDELNNWWDGETVRIAEYWVKEPSTREIALMEDGTVTDAAEGVESVRKRRIHSHRVMQYVMSGLEVLEGPQEWPVKHFPIIPVMGEEVHIGDRVVRHGIVRYAKDPQRLYNYWRTTAAESIALAPKAPWLVTPTMIEGQKAAWEAANKGNPPYLLFKPDPNAPTLGPKREQPPTPPTAMWQEASIAADDMKGTTGIYDASLGAQGNETSGRAILARQQEGDTGTFVYIDNLGRAIRYAGKLLIALIPKIYDTERVVRILGEDDTEDFVTLNVPVPTPDGGVEFMTQLTDKKGNPIFKPALDAGKYDIEIITGPSYSTKRIEAADSMMAFIQAAPQAGALIADLIAKNMDWPGADQIAERLRKALPPGMAEEEDELTEEEMAQRQAAQQQAQMQMEIQLAGFQAEIAKSQAETARSQASAAKDGATVGKVQAETEGVQLDNALKFLEIAVQNGAFDGLLQQRVEQILVNTTGQPANGGDFDTRN